MAIEIGVLLGQYGGGQSFEQISSWTQAGASSLSLQPTDVHSSPSGAALDVFSWDNQLLLTYNYAADNDAFLRWSPDVTTHRIVYQAWTRVGTDTFSGSLTFNAGSYAPANIVPVPYATTLQYVQRDIQVKSGDLIHLRFFRLASVSSWTAYIDDVLVAADVIELVPQPESQERSSALAAEYLTLGGQGQRRVWNTWPGVDLRLHSVPSSHAALLNRWWQNGWNVLMTLDNSDTTAHFVGRIVEGPPCVSLEPPYKDRWQGTLRIEGLRWGLNF